MERIEVRNQGVQHHAPSLALMPEIRVIQRCLKLFMGAESFIRQPSDLRGFYLEARYQHHHTVATLMQALG